MWRITAAAALLSTGLVLGPAARAQHDAAPAPEADAGSADVEVDPATGERFRWVRPSDAMRRGIVPVPAWLAIAGGILVASGAVGMLTWRARRRRR